MQRQENWKHLKLFLYGVPASADLLQGSYGSRGKFWERSLTRGEDSH